MSKMIKRGGSTASAGQKCAIFVESQVILHENVQRKAKAKERGRAVECCTQKVKAKVAKVKERDQSEVVGFVYEIIVRSSALEASALITVRMLVGRKVMGRLAKVDLAGWGKAI